MTCIKFYTGYSGKHVTINDLYNRIAYLYKAEEHMKTYLDTKSRQSTDLRGHLTARHVTTSHEEGLAVMSISIEETHRHIKSINLQVEVTEYLYKCYSKKGKECTLVKLFIEVIKCLQLFFITFLICGI